MLDVDVAVKCEEQTPHIMATISLCVWPSGPCAIFRVIIRRLAVAIYVMKTRACGHLFITTAAVVDLCAFGGIILEVATMIACKPRQERSSITGLRQRARGPSQYFSTAVQSRHSVSLDIHVRKTVSKQKQKHQAVR